MQYLDYDDSRKELIGGWIVPLSVPARVVSILESSGGKVRTGAQYLESLKDGREIVIEGKVVEDVTTHPAFSGICKTIAALYDRVAATPEMTFPSPSSGLAVQVSHLIPRSTEDLQTRRHGLTRFAQHSFGHVGRGPEHVASFFAGFAGTPEFFGHPDRSDGKYARNVVCFHEKIREEHLYVTYTIIPPQIDRSRTAHEHRRRTCPRASSASATTAS